MVTIKTKWYSLPEYCLQPNGLNPSANSLNGISQMDEPIPYINTHVITDKINTDISLVPKENGYFIDSLDKEEFKHCHEMMRLLNYINEQANDKQYYSGSLAIEEWNTCEGVMEHIDCFNHMDYVIWWTNNRYRSFVKTPSLPNMLCDVNGISFEQFYETVFMQECD